MRPILTGLLLVTFLAWSTDALAGLSNEARKVQSRADDLKADTSKVLNARYASKAAAEQAIADIQNRQSALDRDVTGTAGQMDLVSSKTVKTTVEYRVDPATGMLQSRKVYSKKQVWDRSVRRTESLSGQVTYQTRVPPPDAELRSRFQGQSSANGRMTRTEVTAIRQDPANEVVLVEVTSTTR